MKNAILPIILAISFVFLPAAYAEPSVSIIMEKTTYSYCEKLFYIIEVSEITGESLQLFTLETRQVKEVVTF